MFKIDYDDNEDGFCLSKLSAHYFLCYYLPKKFTQDVISTNLLKFKDNSFEIVQKWKLWTVEEFENVDILSAFMM